MDGGLLVAAREDGAVRSGPLELAEADGFVWVSNSGIPGVLRIDETTGHVGNVIRTGSAPGRVTAGGGSVWVEDESDHTITRIDPKAETVVTTIPVNEEIRGMVVAGNDLWAAGGTRTGHWDGSAWTTETPAGNSASLFGVSGIGASLWVVGQNSLILHRR